MAYMPKAPTDHVDIILAQWRRERPDLDVSVVGYLGRLFRVADLADAALAELLAGHRLQPGWFDVLAALRRSGSPYELTPTQLAAATLVTSGGLTKRVDRMEQAGLLTRRPDPTDRRGTMVRLTRPGRAVVDRALADHVRNEEIILRDLTRAERRTLDRLLRRLLAGLEAGRDPASGDLLGVSGAYGSARRPQTRTKDPQGNRPSARHSGR
jgi:DNA-binding MarR family transcriptional regulator